MDVEPVTADRWSDLADLFERKGPRGGTPIPAGCWCMWWRRRTGNGELNKAAMRGLVLAGAEPGLLAYQDGTPVGWVSVGPRAAFGHLVRSRRYGPKDGDAGVWSVVCFYRDPRARRRGVARALLLGAVEQARERGANAVEAYPHERGDYMGSRELFAAAGFEPVRATAVRVVMRKSLS